jgi:polyhydroxyalkanoate synthesis regulator protein
LSKDLLSTLIRSYNDQMQGMVGKYLDQSLRLFMTQQRDLRERIKGVTGRDPVEVAHGIAEKNYQRFKSLQDEVFRVLGNPGAKLRKDRDDDA